LTALFQDFHCDTLLQSHACGADNGPDGFSHASLAAYYFPEFARIDAQLKHGDFFAFNRADLNLVGLIDECLRNRFEQLLHRLPPREQE
jgi:hypothetical protein